MVLILLQHLSLVVKHSMPSLCAFKYYFFGHGLSFFLSPLRISLPFSVLLYTKRLPHTAVNSALPFFAFYFFLWYLMRNRLHNFAADLSISWWLASLEAMYVGGSWNFRPLQYLRLKHSALACHRSVQCCVLNESLQHPAPHPAAQGSLFSWTGLHGSPEQCRSQPGCSWCSHCFQCTVTATSI
jgi:hypothetical protein